MGGKMVKFYYNVIVPVEKKKKKKKKKDRSRVLYLERRIANDTERLGWPRQIFKVNQTVQVMGLVGQHIMNGRQGTITGVEHVQDIRGNTFKYELKFLHRADTNKFFERNLTTHKFSPAEP